MKTRIIGTGSYVPEHKMSNDDLAQLVATNDEWIQEHTGIKERHIADKGLVHMAAKAAQKALEDSKIEVKELDMILVATATPDYSFPNTACQIQDKLNASDIPCMDLSVACSGFLFALNTADVYIKSGTYKTILVIGADMLSKMVDWTDRGTCILFGDGAGAAVVQAADTGLIAAQMGCDGSKGMVLRGGAFTYQNPLIENNSDGKIWMDGSEVFKFAVRKIPDTIMETLKKANKQVEDVTYFILHQANRRILEAAARRLNISIDRFPMNIDKYGNMSAASIPILLDELNHEGRLKRGQLLLLAGFGAGLSWGSALVEW